MHSDLIAAIEHSDQPKAKTILESLLSDSQADPMAIHDALFPVVHKVLNPPFINPHLAKMYAINRELVVFLEPSDIASLLRVEVQEYTRREKLPPLAEPVTISSSGVFSDIEKAVAGQDVYQTALTMAAYSKGAEPAQLAGRLLLLGSGFLNQSLGHSVSCTAFILLELIHRHDQDPWPALVLLADYFCKGRFQRTPELQYTALSAYREVYLGELKKAVSGTGIVALHHTITLYTIERCRHLFEPREYDHMLTMWSQMFSDKHENLRPVSNFTATALPRFYDFFKVFSRYDPVPVLNMVKGSLEKEDDRSRFGRYLIKGVLGCYDGQYNPHYLTGLGSALWVLESFHGQPEIVLNALYQYLEFFFSGVNSARAR
ncbi:MAG: hypothetical protein WBB19_08025 [Desulforhopalus sp.]